MEIVVARLRFVIIIRSFEEKDKRLLRLIFVIYISRFFFYFYDGKTFVNVNIGRGQ